MPLVVIVTAATFENICQKSHICKKTCAIVTIIPGTPHFPHFLLLSLYYYLIQLWSPSILYVMVECTALLWKSSSNKWHQWVSIKKCEVCSVDPLHVVQRIYRYWFSCVSLFCFWLCVCAFWMPYMWYQWFATNGVAKEGMELATQLTLIESDQWLYIPSEAVGGIQGWGSSLQFLLAALTRHMPASWNVHHR